MKWAENGREAHAHRIQEANLSIRQPMPSQEKAEEWNHKGSRQVVKKKEDLWEEQVPIHVRQLLHNLTPHAIYPAGPQVPRFDRSTTHHRARREPSSPGHAVAFRFDEGRDQMGGPAGFGTPALPITGRRRRL